MLNLEVKSMLKHGNLDLENLIKAEMDNFDEGIWCYLSVQQAVTQMVGDGGERQLWVVTRCSHLKNPTLCHLYWNCEVMNEMK